MRQKMTFIIMPVGLNCNLSCRYCYHGDVSKKLGTFAKMSDDVLRRIFINALEFQSDIDFLWHGGEPLLAGIEHFQKAAKFQDAAFLTGNIYNGRVRNIVQTNMTLFNETFCDFFAEENFVLSTSIDGDKIAHDSNRIHCNGKGTYIDVMDAIAMWREKGQKIGAVSLITDKNVEKAKETFEALKASGITSFNFHFCAQDDVGSVDGIPEHEKTVNFFKNVFDLWLKDDNPEFPIRNFRNVLRFLCGGRPLDCTSNVNGCYGFMAINSNGDVYPCHRYVERRDFCIGNILESSLVDIYNNAESVYAKLCSVNQKCHSCEWLELCGNGCAFERLTMRGSFEETAPECLMKKDMFRYIRERTKDIIP